MMRSMFTGVSGLRAHQTKMDVIGNNIANVNTVGYKASSVTFREIYAQTLQGSSSPNADTGRGGTNPMQIGLGVAVASIDNLISQGAAQTTDNPLDLMINGNSFFIVGDASTGYYFTRAGAFRLDQDGNLVNPAGLRVYGWNATEDPNNPGQQKIIKGNVQPLVIKSPQNMYVQPEMTKNASFEGNLNMEEGMAEGGIVKSVDFFDSLGNRYKLEYTIVYNESAQAWEMQPASTMIRNDDANDVITITPGKLKSIGIQFNLDGTIKTTGTVEENPAWVKPPVAPTAGPSDEEFIRDTTYDPVEFTTTPNPNYGKSSGATLDPTGGPITERFLRNPNYQPNEFTNTPNPNYGIPEFIFVADDPIKTSFDIPRFDPDELGVLAETYEGTDKQGNTIGINVDLIGVTQFKQNTTVKGMSLDGCTAGEMIGFSIGPDGKITGTYSNGRMKLLGQIAVASFKNPAGLEKVGDNLFTQSPNSGGFDGMGQEATVGGGSIGGGRLEMSNVDLSKEFTEMITTQRGFQANARVITTSDEMLQELVRLK